MHPLLDPSTTEVIDALPHIVWAADAAGVMQYCNQRGIEFGALDLSGGRHVGWQDLLHPDDAAAAVGVWSAAAASGTPYTLTARLRRADGVDRWMEVRGAPWRDDEGAVHGWVGTCTDVHEQRMAEEALNARHRDAAEGAALLDTLLATSPIGFALVDADFRVLLVNATLASITGQPPAAFLGRTVGEIVPDVWPMLEADMRRALDTNNPVLDLELSSKALSFDDPRVWWTGFYPIHTAPGELLGLGIVMIDVTERHRAEQARESYSAALERAHAERRELLAQIVTVSEQERRRIAADIHDDTIQVLAATDLRLQLMRRAVAAALPGEVAAVDTLRDLVHDATGRLRRMVFDLEPPLAGGGIAASIEATAHEVLDPAGVAVTVTSALEREPDHDTVALAHRIAREALVNVVKHAAAGSVTINLRESDEHLEVTVEDDGVGATSTGYRAGHLGLVSMRERAELAGGSFELAAWPAVGTRVRVRLPL